MPLDLNHPVYISRILQYACKTEADPWFFAQVTSSWCEAVRPGDFGGIGALIWNQLRDENCGGYPDAVFEIPVILQSRSTSAVAQSSTATRKKASVLSAEYSLTDVRQYLSYLRAGFGKGTGKILLSNEICHELKQHSNSNKSSSAVETFRTSAFHSVTEIHGILPFRFLRAKKLDLSGFTCLERIYCPFFSMINSFGLGGTHSLSEKIPVFHRVDFTGGMSNLEQIGDRFLAGCVIEHLIFGDMKKVELIANDFLYHAVLGRIEGLENFSGVKSIGDSFMAKVKFIDVVVKSGSKNKSKTSEDDDGEDDNEKHTTILDLSGMTQLSSIGSGFCNFAEIHDEKHASAFCQSNPSSQPRTSSTRKLKLIVGNKPHLKEIPQKFCGGSEFNEIDLSGATAVTKIGANFCGACSRLQKVSFPQSQNIDEIKAGFLWKCYGFVELDLGNSLSRSKTVTIGSRFCDGNLELKKVILFDNNSNNSNNSSSSTLKLKADSTSAQQRFPIGFFPNCSKLVELDLSFLDPETKIDDDAEFLSSSTNLRKLILPKSIPQKRWGIDSNKVTIVYK